MKGILLVICFISVVNICSSQTANEYLESGSKKYELEDYQGAIEDYSQAIKLDPNNAILCYLRGHVREKTEDYQGAIVDYNKVIELDADYAEAYYNRGLAKYLSGNERGGCIDFGKAKELGNVKAISVYNEYCK